MRQRIAEEGQLELERKRKENEEERKRNEEQLIVERKDEAYLLELREEINSLRVCLLRSVKLIA